VAVEATGAGGSAAGALAVDPAAGAVVVNGWFWDDLA
jgi:hypothetical protein